MKITVALGSSRPGGVDVSFFGLARQTFTDFEVVFADARYHRRHALVLDEWRRANEVAGTRVPAKLHHVPNHRSQPLWQVNSAGFNTTFALAEGEIVAMLLDFAFTPPDWLEKLVRAHEGAQRLVMAPHSYHDLPPVRTRDGGPTWVKYDGHVGRSPEEIVAQRDRYDEISIFARPFAPDQIGPASLPPHCDPKLHMPEGPCDPGCFHTKNESFPLDAILEVNGMDERFDRGAGPGDPELGHRLARVGLEPWLCQSPALCLNPRWVLPQPNASGFYDRPTPGHEWRGSYMDGQRYFEQSMAEGRVRARNPFEIRELRERIWHWREASQERDAVIPSNEVSDAAYWPT